MIWFDRDDILGLLARRAEGFEAGYRQNLALLGPEGIGKSTCLKRFLISSDEQVKPSGIPFYLEMEEADSLGEWADRFVQALLYGVLRASGEDSLPTGRGELLRVSARRVPKTCAAARRLLDLAQTGRAEEVFDRLWDLLPQATRETGLPVLALLDEFDRLERLEVKEPFRRLGRKIMVQNTTWFLVTSSHPAEARRILREGLSLLFGQFEVVPVGPLTSRAVLKAIRVSRPDLAEDPFLEYLLMKLVQGHPANLELILQGIRERWEPALAGRDGPDGRGPSHLRVLLDLMEGLLLEPDGAFRLRFEQRLRALPVHRNRIVWIEVLSSVAGGVHRLEPLCEMLERPAVSVRQALRVLEEAGLLIRQGGFYRLPDPLFRLWLRTAYPVLQGIGQVDPIRARVLFRDRLDGWMSQLRARLRQPLSDHIRTLLSRWGGETVWIEGRRLLLPGWKRVRPLAGPEGRILLAAEGRLTAGKRRGRDWLVVPAPGSLREDSAREWVRWIGGMPEFKTVRKVIAGSEPVDVHARLILGQAGIRVWDLDVLNQLLALYALPPIPGRRDLPAYSGEAEPIPALNRHDAPEGAPYRSEAG